MTNDPTAFFYSWYFPASVTLLVFFVALNNVRRSVAIRFREQMAFNDTLLFMLLELLIITVACCLSLIVWLFWALLLRG